MTLYITPDNNLHDDADGFALTLPSFPKDARIATQEEIDAILNPPKTMAELNAESNAIILAQIAKLEAQQARPLREIALGDTTYSVTKLQSLNNQTAALRAQLV